MASSNHSARRMPGVINAAVFVILSGAAGLFLSFVPYEWPAAQSKDPGVIDEQARFEVNS